jgi:hypothetical protein
MHRRWRIGLGSATTVVLAGGSGALINELHGGWGWAVAAGAVVLVGAVLTGWLAMRAAEPPAGGDRLGDGAVKAGRDITGAVRTEVAGQPTGNASRGQVGDRLGPGAVKAGRDIRGDVTTHVDSRQTRPPGP